MNQTVSALDELDLPTRVQSMLARSPHFLGRRLSAEVHGDNVVLSGVVDTYYLKQLAQESIRELAGVGGIRNEIEVQSLTTRTVSRDLRFDASTH